MSSYMPILMIFVGGLFVGGVISFIRNSQPWLAVACGVAAVLSFGGAVAWYI